jgi:methionine biosynthesis protein MetW
MFYFRGTRKPDFKNIQKIDYDAYWKHRGFELNKKLKEREVIMSDLIQTQESVLDIGCGNSLMPVILLKKGVSVEVADISKEVLKGFTKEGIKTTFVDLEKVEQFIPGKKYDWIILSEVLEHLTNPEDVVRGLCAHTRGFLLTVPNSGFYRFRLHLLFSGRFFTQWVYHPSEHVRFWTHIDFMDWLRAFEFVNIKALPSNGFTFLGIPLYRIWPNLFAHQIVYVVSLHE